MNQDQESDNEGINNKKAIQNKESNNGNQEEPNNSISSTRNYPYTYQHNYKKNPRTFKDFYVYSHLEKTSRYIRKAF